MQKRFSGCQGLGTVLGRERHSMNIKGITRDLCGNEIILYLDCMVVIQICL